MKVDAELDLVARANAGDEAAFETLFRAHTPAMKAAAARLFHRLQLYPVWPLAEDAAQEAWLRHPLGRFDSSRGTTLRSLLCAHTRRAAIDVARKLIGKRLVVRWEREPDPDRLQMPARTPQQDARLELSRLFSGRCKVALPPTEKIVLDRWMRDEFASATCRRLGLSESRIFQLRGSAVDRVRASIARQGAAA